MNGVCSLEAPDLAEAIEAWRAWRIVERQGELLLASVVQSTVWPTGEALTARCLRHAPFRWFKRKHLPEPAPDPGCDCGIYATWLEDAGVYLRDASDVVSVGRAIGQVSLWGTVVECERGFRASHAYPRSLYVPHDFESRRKGFSAQELAAALASYLVPVEVLPATGFEAATVLARRQLQTGEGRAGRTD